MKINVYEYVGDYGGGVCFVEAGSDRDKDYIEDNKNWELVGTLEEFVENIKSFILMKKEVSYAYYE